MPQHDAISGPQRDNLLGICHALGETFGFDPLWLRIAFAVMLLASVEAALIAYAICGVGVLAGHLLAPRKTRGTVTMRATAAA